MTRTFTLKAHRPALELDLEGQLNDQQRAVVTATGGPMLVVAGAGSGKTRSLTWRLARLLRDGVPPERVLLMTFTNRAAREMLHRVELLVQHDAGRVWCGTFHHVANRVLRTHGEHVGVHPDFTILDREDAGDVLAACISEAGVNRSKRRFPSRAALATIASAIASTDQTLAEVLEKGYPSFAGLADAITVVLDLYRQRKRERRLMDYDDLLLAWDELMEQHPVIAGGLSRRFVHVLVDEFQDTNRLQARIVEHLGAVHGNICVVGDDAQSIYRFRGADPSGFTSFLERHPDATVHKLEVNYRSTPEILELANASIANNSMQVPKTLRAARPSGLRAAVVPCGDHLVQSRFIAEYILHLLDEGRCLMDIAVLYRSHWHAMEIQLELQRRDIPFQVRGGIRFFEQAHVKDVLAFLRVRHNEHDALAWHRVLRLVPRVGDAHAHTIWKSIESAEHPITAARTIDPDLDVPRAVRDAYERFGRVLEALERNDGPAEMIRQVMSRFYADYMEGHWQNAALRRQDVDGIVEFASQYNTVEAFLTDAALTGDFTAETCEDGPSEQLFVTLSTVHQAKGLEWPIVLIPWVCDGRFPTDMAMGSDEELQEERRVFHVAVTRARDELYLVVPQVWSNHRQRRIVMKPSRFLAEVEEQAVVETMRIEGDLPETTVGARALSALASKAD